MPFFSIIIPLYNKEKFIQNTINSVLNQSFLDYEIIIVDDGSTDKSSELVKEIKNEKISYYRIENLGVSNARNIGIQKSKADFICFLDADDYWYPHYLQEMYDCICEFPTQKVFACAIEFQIDKKIIPSVYSVTKNEKYQVVNYFEGSLKQSVIWTSSSVFEKSVFETSGVFNTKYKVGEDTDLWVRIGLNFPVVFIWKIGARYVFDENSLSLNRSKTDCKAEFTEYIELENANKPLKKFLDYSRFSLAIESKIQQKNNTYNRFRNQIDKNNLPFKKRILLNLPSNVLVFLVKTKKYLAKLGVGNSVFK